MSSITVSQAWAWLLTLAAGVITLSKLWDIIREHLKPQKRLREDVAKHAELLSRDKERFDSMERVLKEQSEVNALIFRALFAQINHQISGNGDEILKKARDDLQAYLAGRR